MLLKHNNRKVVTSILFTGLLTLLASCENSSAIESMLGADPQLSNGIETQAKDEPATSTPDSEKTSSNPPEKTLEPTATKDNSANDRAEGDNQDTEEADSPDDSIVYRDNSFQTQSQTKTAVSREGLPEDFPPSFPIYPRGELQETKAGQNKASGMLTWNSSDNSKAIADFYQAELTAKDWDIIKPFTFNPQQKIARAIAVKEEQRIDLTLFQFTNQDTDREGTKISVIYQPLGEAVAKSGISQGVDTESENNGDNTLKSASPSPSTARETLPQEQIGNQKTKPIESSPDLVTPKENPLALEDLSESDYIPPFTADFTDLDNAPEQLIMPLETVAALGILTPYTQNGNVELSKFAPNAVITRGEYARWLIAANNHYYEGNPGKKIYVAKNKSESVFQDIKGEHPDFGAIQGLAEAGLVPSRLTQDSTKLLFRPNAPLTREALITWKVPLDLRQALPKASIPAIEESWGFQDAAEIDSSAIRALYADFQNGDRSNIRRIFGFTTLFQPKKPVTRAEAAASLWYFGFQGDGITAQEILEVETESESESELPNS